MFQLVSSSAHLLLIVPSDNGEQYITLQTVLTSVAVSEIKEAKRIGGRTGFE